MKEKYKNARAFIVLLAALITMLINIKYDRELLESLITLLIVIVVFIVIANVAIFLIDKIANMSNNIIVDDFKDENNEQTQEEG